MKEKIDRTLLKGSIVLLVCFGIFNMLNFIYHILMARSLSIVDYGILSSMLSIGYIFGVFSDSILLILVKYTTNVSELGKLKNILKRSFKKAFFVSVFIFIAYLLISIPLSKLLKIDYYLLSLNGLLIFLVFFLPVSRGIMQGKKRFFAFGGNMALESLSKIILGVSFVFLGLKIYGALGGFILAGAIAFLFSLLSIKDILKAKESRAETQGIYDYTKSAFIITFVVSFFFNIDIVFAKAFFPGNLAGSYAIASILAKTIFWGTQPISRAMFPISVENNKKGKNKNILGNSLFILATLIVSALLVFYFFPDLIIKIFSGKNVAGASQVIFYLGISMALLSFTNLFLLHYLSLNRIKFAPLRIYSIFAVLLVCAIITASVYIFYNLSIFLYLTFALIFCVTLVFLYSLTKRYDIGFMFFVIAECALLYIFRNNLIVFSIALITAAAIFLWGTIFLLRD